MTEVRDIHFAVASLLLVWFAGWAQEGNGVSPVRIEQNRFVTDDTDEQKELWNGMSEGALILKALPRLPSPGAESKAEAVR